MATSQARDYQSYTPSSNALKGYLGPGSTWPVCSMVTHMSGAWWRADLGAAKNVSEMRISGVQNGAYYMVGLEVRFGSSSTYTGNPVFGTPTTQAVSVAGEAQVFKPASPMEGRYINVFQADQQYLSICDIEILEA